MPAQETLDYGKVMTDLIQKQMIILGPDITFAKVKNVGKITIDTNGRVIKIESPNPNELLQGLVDEFIELSEEVSRKSVESLLTAYPSLNLQTSSKTTHFEKEEAIAPPTVQNVYNSSVHAQTREKEEKPQEKVAKEKEEKAASPRKVVNHIRKVDDYSSIDGLRDDDIKKVTDLFQDAHGHVG